MTANGKRVGAFQSAKLTPEIMVEVSLVKNGKPAGVVVSHTASRAPLPGSSYACCPPSASFPLSCCHTAMATHHVAVNWARCSPPLQITTPYIRIRAVQRAPYNPAYVSRWAGSVEWLQSEGQGRHC